MTELPVIETRPAYVYIVKCADNTIYSGWTYDLEARLKRHNARLGSRYTRARLPVRMVYSESLEDQQAARRREYRLKRLTRSEKLALITVYEAAM